LRDRPFTHRRERLVDLYRTLQEPWNLTPSTTDLDTAKRWFDEFESAGCDGIVAKAADSPYQSGKRAMIKIKHRRTVDVVVGGCREHRDGGNVGSLLVGRCDGNGELVFVGHCSRFRDTDREELFGRFSELAADESFGSQVRVPGAESRWSAG